MINITTFIAHDIPTSGGGTLAYCKALEQLFKDSTSIQIKESSILPHNSLLGFKYKSQEIKEYLKTTNPDIIHINGYTSLLLSQLTPLANSLGIKIVYTPHWHPFHTMRYPLLKNLYFYLFIKPYLKYVDAIVNINKEDYTFFKKFSDNVHLIPHWMSSEIQFNKSIERIRNQILFVGSLTHPNKGFKYLFNLPENKYKIICVGEGENINLRSDMIHYKDMSRTDLEILYRQSSLVVIPSKYEAFSYVALEALCSGTPVVMSDRVRIADFIPNFKGIKTFNLNFPRQFNSSVEEMIGQEFDTEFISKRFSKQIALKKYSDLYNSLLLEQDF